MQGSGGQPAMAERIHTASPQQGPCAHLDLLLQVFSSSHEVLNLPRGGHAYGFGGGGAFRVSSSSFLLLSRTLYPIRATPL